MRKQFSTEVWTVMDGSDNQINNMKKIIATVILCLGISGFAQKKYSDVEHLVTNAIDSYQSESDELLFLKIVKNNFEESNKLKEKHLKKNNVGIAFLFSNGEEKPIILPAKFSSKNKKINASIVEGLPEEVEDYVDKYFHKIESLGSTAVFQKMMQMQKETGGNYAVSKSEFYSIESSKTTFIRGNDDWMYCVTVDESNKENSAKIILYAFKISLSGEDIFNAGNSSKKIEERRQELIAKSKSESNKFPLYHDFRTDEIRDGLAKIIKVEPFKSDKGLIDIFKKLEEPITRYNIVDYAKEFKFLLSANISKEVLDKNFQPFEEEEVFNIKHLASHALADYHFGIGKYDIAIEYYKKSIFQFPYEESSGTGVVKDAERILYDIAKSNYYAGKKDDAYGFLIGLIIDSQRNYELASKTINEYMEAENEDRNKLKNDIDKALKTIKEGKSYTYTFIFRNKEFFFFPMMPESQQEYEKYFKESKFYQSL